jgi:hypothetical protein
VRIKTLPSSFCVLIAAAAAAATLGSPGSASAAPASGPVTPVCAWHEFSVATTNVLEQDSAEAEWLLLYQVQDGLQIRLDGRYPDSRYASLQNYDAAGLPFTVNGVTSGLTDYQIQPDPGSVNPWQYSPGDHRRGGNAFTVTLQSDVAPGQANTLPLAPAGETGGALFYRVYLPAGGDFSRVPLPVVTFTVDGVSQQVPACPSSTASTAPAPAAPTPANALAQLKAGMPARLAASRAAGPATGATAQTPEFVPVMFSNGDPNADTAYLSAQVIPPPNGDVLVIRGKAPTASRGSHPSPWPVPFTDLRYWSLCNYLPIGAYPLVVNQLPGGKIDYGCRYDSQVATDRHGYYTFVVGTEAQRPVIERIPGATFLPFSATDSKTTQLLLLRNTLPNPGFAQAIQNVQGGSAASAAMAMGPYYPRTAICQLSTLFRGGPGACLAGTS